MDSPQEGWERWQAQKTTCRYPTGKSKTCIIHGPGNYPEECKVLGDFGTKHANSSTTKDHRINPVPRKCFNIHQKINAIFNNAVDEILINETQKLSAEREAQEFLDSDYDDNNLYQVYKMSLEETKQKLDWCKRGF